jgi:tricorn protease
MTSNGRAVTSNVYAIVLRTNMPSPVAPESDEEKFAAEKTPEEKPSPLAPSADDREKDRKDAGKEPAKPAADDKTAKKAPPNVLIEFDNIGQRIVTLPLPARNYSGLQAGAAGVIYVLEQGQQGAFGSALYRFDLESRRPVRLLEGVLALRISFDGK